MTNALQGCGTPAECMATAIVSSAQSQGATLIERSRPTAISTPTPWPTPTLTPLPTLTATPQPTWTPLPTYTPYPTPTLAPTWTPVVTSMPPAQVIQEPRVLGATPAELLVIGALFVSVLVLAVLIGIAASRRRVGI